MLIRWSLVLLERRVLRVLRLNMQEIFQKGAWNQHFSRSERVKQLFIFPFHGVTTVILGRTSTNRRLVYLSLPLLRSKNFQSRFQPVKISCNFRWSCSEPNWRGFETSKIRIHTTLTASTPRLPDAHPASNSLRHFLTGKVFAVLSWAITTDVDRTSVHYGLSDWCQRLIRLRLVGTCSSSCSIHNSL